MQPAFIADDGLWAEATFDGNLLPDDRLGDRLKQYAASQAADPAASTSAACRGDKAAREGAYRLLENERVTAEDIEEGPFSRTAELCGGRRVVLAIQDTTGVGVKYGPLAKVIQSPGSPTGFVVHSTLMVDGDSGEILGLLEQQRWIREPKVPGEKKRDTRAYEDRESYKWEAASRSVCDRLDDPDAVVTVGDRETDIKELLGYHLESQRRFVLRAKVDRRVDGEAGFLWATLEQAPVVGSREVTVCQRGGQEAKGIQSERASRPQRVAKTELRAATVLLKDLGQGSVDEARSVNVVLVREVDPPKGVEPLEWLLLTSEPVGTFDEVSTVVRYYEKRWVIEEFHKCWKTGCRVDDRPLQDPRSIECLMVILASIAVRMLQLHALANQTETKASCEPVLAQDEWQCLWSSTENSKPMPKAPPTARWAYSAIAKLGGWYDTKRTGRVGWDTMWAGWSKFRERLHGWRAHASTIRPHSHL